MKICDTCVMDETAQEIVFYDDGTCNFCRGYQETSKNDLHLSSEDKLKLKKFIMKLKKKSKKGKYDCLIGVSGGVDSSYVAYLVKEVYGLNPLALHIDNGWNSELAVANIESLLTKLDIDLVTEVLNWNQFKKLQTAFLYSGISNIEIPTDHAIWATLLQTAKKYKIKYIFAGNNVVNECIMPSSWLYGSKDSTLIRDIYYKHYNKKLKNYPYLSIFDYIRYLVIYRIKWFPILNYVDFNKSDAKKYLIQNLEWRDYGGKHHESLFTKFFHEDYVLNKFGYNLNKSYLSAEVCSGQITREDALKALNKNVGCTELEQNRKYVFRKLGLDISTYDTLIENENKTYKHYENEQFIWDYFSGVINKLRNFITKI